MDFGYNLNDQIICQSGHCRPVLDVWSKMDLHFRMSHTLAVINSVVINRLIKMIFWMLVFNICQIGCRCQESFISCCCCDRTGIHQCNRSYLAILKLGTFTVREVTCCVTDTESIIRRCVTSTKARTAESCLQNGTCCKQISCHAVSQQFHINWCTCRINIHGKLV